MKQINDIPNLESWQKEQENIRCVIAIASETDNEDKQTLSVTVAGGLENLIETLVGVFREDIKLRALCEFAVKVVRTMEEAKKVAAMTEDEQKEEDKQ